ncbi:hypothetical protein PAXRUDRAFT_18598 [Paxillus rubicundulus Ve08.2h10]|uniref:Unplaced genomic scaffold scaffold_2971, whole genome shotgun sequence n=1 Tax=Paxillus rubicundulus Ve08.2h10 TaxID=930991 RepID=A0A0D0CXK2_9AGAM|nr:hypothetical protein PAXRUDRAFT_18598 [Paxillus rubicundulus Ve08.2h10]
MSSSTTNDLTKWSDEQLRENEDDKDKLFKKKSAERRRRTKAEEEAKQKAEVKAQRRAEAEAKAHAEEVVWVQVSSVVVNVPLTDLLGVETELDLGPIEGETAKGDGEQDRRGRGVGRGLSPVLRMLGPWGGMRDEGGWEQQGEVVQPLLPTVEQVQPSWRRKQEEVMSLQAGKKKARTKSLAAEDDKEDVEDCEAEENRDVLGALAEVLSAMVGEMQNMAADRRRAAAESHVQMERVLGTLEEIRGCLDPEFVPEEGSEENFNEGEVAEAARERETLKGRNEEEEEVDESV